MLKLSDFTRPIGLLAGITLLLGIASFNFSFALDATKTGVNGGLSIEEIASQIRKDSEWQILNASPRQDATGLRYFRFKLLNKKGTVKVIHIDPAKPDLKRLK